MIPRGIVGSVMGILVDPLGACKPLARFRLFVAFSLFLGSFKEMPPT